MSTEALALLMITAVAVGALNLAGIRLLFKQHEIGDLERFDVLLREGTDYSHALGHQLSSLKSDLSTDYVRREDWIRFGAVIDAKLDHMRRDMESLRERLYGQSES